MVEVFDVLTQPVGHATATMDVSFICMKKSNVDDRSRAVAAANARHRSYSLFAGCPPNCRPPYGTSLYPVPLARSVTF